MYILYIYTFVEEGDLNIHLIIDLQEQHQKYVCPTKIMDENGERGRSGSNSPTSPRKRSKRRTVRNQK